MTYLDRVYYGNSVEQWLVALAIFLGTIAAMFAVRYLVARRLRALARRTSTDLDDLGIGLLDRTRPYFVVAVAVAIAVSALDLTTTVAFVLRIAVSIAVLLQLAAWGNELIAFFLRRYGARGAEDGAQKMMLGVVGVLLRILLWAILVVLALDNVLGLDVTALVTGLGIGGIAIALAVQNILGDLLAAAAIVVDKPFVVGDFVVVNEYMGNVEQIGLKTTRIRSLSGEQIIISNADMLGARIRNMKRMYERRVVFAIGVTYDTSRAQLERIPGMIRAAIEAREQVRFDRAHFKGFGASSLDFEAVYYVLSPDYTRYMDIQQAINLELVERFEAAGIGFAFPTRTVHLVDARGGDGAVAG